MTDPRITKLAESLVNYSCEIKPGEKVLIELFDCDDALAEELLKAVYNAGGIPFLHTENARAKRAWLMGLTEEQALLQAKWDAARMSDMDAYIAFRGSLNTTELSDVPEERMKIYETIYQNKVHSDIRVNKTKWCVLRYPNGSMAQNAGLSTKAMEDFYFNVCCLDYSKMKRAMQPLKELMEKTDRVRIVSPGTDLSFSIKGQNAIPCAGEMNVPDGEVYTSPILNSVNGKIKYNAPSLYNGFRFTDVELTFKDGKIIAAHANSDERINAVLNTDDGARYVGEFAIGVNPYILEPMCDILFDEKISGSIHFTPGEAYEDADNKNRSAVHWDLVLIQRQSHGGGEIWFDDKLIRKDGIFTLPELYPLNPENLK